MSQTTLSVSLDAGQCLSLSAVSWQRFQSLLTELGDRRNSRLAYADGIFELMTPLPEHERTKVILADLVKILLRLYQLPWEPLGSTTLKKENKSVGVEPDECFYIQNYQAVIGKDRLDLTIDPPPDLAIEVDLTSKTKLAAYVALEVPELWFYSNERLKIYLWQSGDYQASEISLMFPHLPILEIIPQFIQRAKVAGVSQTLLEFENYCRSLI